VNGCSTDVVAPTLPPKLSVVVASFSTDALLMRSLTALNAQAHPARVEVIVVRDVERSDDAARAAARARFPEVRWIDAAAGSTVPLLRTLGIAESRGEIVALIEDDCVVRPGWSTAATDAINGLEVAAGGAVEPGPYRRALDWGVYFCEYARFMLPVPTTVHAPIPGNNAVYKRGALMRLPHGTEDGFQEVFVQAAWRAMGLVTSVSGAMVVENINTWSLKHVTAIPYHHGRAYAGRRFGSRHGAFRFAVAVLTVPLPALKTLRIAATVVSRRRLLGRLLQALPWILVFNASWSAGEGMGCLFGPGDSALRWR
jgi:Glycosyltransferase like family 2